MLLIANGALVVVRALLVDVHHLLLVRGRDNLVVDLLLTVVNQQALHVPLLLYRVVHPVVRAVHLLLWVFTSSLAWPQCLQRAVLVLLVHAHLCVREASIEGADVALQGGVVGGELVGDVVGGGVRRHADAVTVHCEERLRVVYGD